jgi:hypothetical protein
MSTKKSVSVPTKKTIPTYTKEKNFSEKSEQKRNIISKNYKKK